jgi:thioredoxin 2
MDATASLTIPCPQCGAGNRVPGARLGEAPHCGRCHGPLFSGTPLVLDAAGFERHAARSDLPLLVDFWAAWCGPCQQMAPQFAAAAPLLEPHVRLGKVDTEAEQALAARFAIRSIPTLVLVRDAREVARQSGAMGRDQIVRWARAQLGG